MMNPEAAIWKEVEHLEEEMIRQGERLAELKRRLPREEVRDYTLAGPQGTVKLSSLFGDKPDLILIHNMGKGCRYCTLWADGFNGIHAHLADRSGFAVISPDTVDIQQKFAASRGWTFPMVSGQGSTFIEDMGFRGDKSWMPGVSTFHKAPDGTIVRVAKASFGPGDLYCSIWHLFGMLADGAGDWKPQYEY